MENIIKANSQDGEKILKTFIDIRKKREIDTQEWVGKLRKAGVKACHPNDGWVDRINKKIHLAYPFFNDGLKIGDKLMIGSIDDKKNQRLVEIISVKKQLLTYFYFKDIKTK